MTDKTLPAEGKVFVATYGSLRAGQGNYRVNEMAGGEPIGKGLTKEKYDLYRYHGCYFPSISLEHNESDTQVVVEVFEAPERGLKGSYDSLEGHRGNDNPHTFYKRTVVPIILDDGREVDAWIYHIDEVQSERVDHGDWVKFLEAQA